MNASLALNRVEDAYARLKAEIRSNRLPPGHVATEPELALSLGMSRTPVREAIVRLQAEGLVEAIPRRGVRVRPIRPEDMQEIYEILTAVEPEAAHALALRDLGAHELDPLEVAIQKMEHALASQDLDAWAEADDAFHSSLLKLHGNQRLCDLVSALLDQSHRARMVTLRMRELPKKSTLEHREILDHIRAGQAGAARSAFRKHRKRAAKELLGLLQNFGLSQL